MSEPTPKVIGWYKVGAEIGRGSFANVYKGVDLQKHQPVAIKSVSRSLLKSKKLLENLEIEISILKDLKHPQIVELLDYQQTDTHFHLIMEYCSLGDLSFFIRKKDELVQKHPLVKTMFNKYPTPNIDKFHGLNKILVLNYLKQLSSALKFLRSKNLVHRDIKPQNLLLAPPIFDLDKFNELGFVGLPDLPILKIADFGFARFLPNTSLAETLCGSPLYMAPEILNYQKYTAKADLWSVGAVLYEMSVGRPPFRAANHLELLNKIKKTKDKIHFPSLIQEYIDPQIKRLICALLKFEPTERMGFNEFFENEVVNYDLNLLLNDVDQKIHLEPSQVNENLFISEYISKGAIINNNNIIEEDDETESADNTPAPTSEPKKIQQQDIQSINKPVHNKQQQKQQQLVPSQRQRQLKNSDVYVEKEYIIVEKTAVEVNALADELANAGTGVGAIALPATYQQQYRRSSRASSGSSNGAGRRPSFEARRLSISLSPTNALSKALGLASARLFGPSTSNNISTSVSSQIPSPPITNKANNVTFMNDILMNPNNHLLSTIRNSNDPSKIDIIAQLENLATKAHVINLFAEVKFSQLIPLPPSMNSYAIEDDDDDDNGILGTNSHGDVDEVNLPPEVIKVLADEAVLLYVKTLSLLSKAMNVASEWWHKNNEFGNSGSVGSASNSSVVSSVRLNEIVQWIRKRFNECLSKAEFVRLKLEDSEKKLLEKNGPNYLTELNFPKIYSERLIYDRALEIAKNTAKMEMTYLSQSQNQYAHSTSYGSSVSPSSTPGSNINGNGFHVTENLIGCELAYTTSIWMLEALLDEDVTDGVEEANNINGVARTSASKLEDGDKQMILKYIESISTRLQTLRKNISGEQ